MGLAGIIAVAAADELTVAHPGDPGTLASVSLTLGGAALFVAGHGAFLWAITGRVSRARLAVVALAALIPVGFAVPALVLAGAAALIVVLLPIADSLVYRRRRRARRRVPTQAS